MNNKNTPNKLDHSLPEYGHTIKKQAQEVESSIEDDLQFYKQRCSELERQLNLRTTREQQFQDINPEDHEKLARIVHQKKTEADLWKRKYENQLSQLIQIKANYELEIRQLSSEIQKLNLRIESVEFDKQRQLIENQTLMDAENQLVLESIKKSKSQTYQHVEQQIKHLKEQLADKNQEIYDLNSKLLRARQEGDEENKRILRENEQLRVKVNEMEIGKQKEIEELTTNLNIYQEEQIRNLKMSQFSQNNIIESEVGKLRGLLEIKNSEIQTLIVQNQKMKALYEEDAEALKSEVSLLKQRVFEQERSTRRRLEEQEMEQRRAQQKDMEQMQREHERWVGQLEADLEQLKESNSKKDYEIQLQASEKEQSRGYLEQQLEALRHELDAERSKTASVDRQKQREIAEVEQQYEQRQSFLAGQSEQLKAQVIFLNGEIERLKDGMHLKAEELKQQSSYFAQMKRQLEDDIRRFRAECESVREDLIRFEQLKDAEMKEIQERSSNEESVARERIRKLEAQCARDSNEIARLKEHLQIKSQEIDNLLVERNQLEREIRRKGDEIEELEGKIINLDRIRNQCLDEMKLRMENKYKYELTSLKNDMNRQMTILQEENRKMKLDNSRDGFQAKSRVTNRPM